MIEIVGMNITVREVGIKWTYAFEVHAVHCLVHPSNDGRHVACYLAHGHGRLDPTGDCVYAAGKPKKV